LPGYKLRLGFGEFLLQFGILDHRPRECRSPYLSDVEGIAEIAAATRQF
jgi:hypothetical protein